MANEIPKTELHRIVLTAIIYRKDEGSYRYLITQRSRKQKAFPGLWTVPGGGVSTDDYVHEPPTHSETNPQWYSALTKALHREVKEEVNLSIYEPEFLLDLAFIRPDGVPVIVLSYYAELKEGEVELDTSDELGEIDFAWVTLDELGKYDMISGIADEIKMVDERLQTKR